jgi:hypothetical protein
MAVRDYQHTKQIKTETSNIKCKPNLNIIFPFIPSQIQGVYCHDSVATPLFEISGFTTEW